MTTDEVEALLADLRKAVQRKECWTCDCLQGFLTQLEMDAGPAAAKAIQSLKMPSAQMHGCLGCDPCPPGALFANYLCRQQASCCANDCSCRKEQASNE